MTRVIVCCDGLDPAYLDAHDTPGWDAIAAEGRSGTCECSIPSLTNVNNVGIVTGAHPDQHGITGNTFFDREQGERVYMREPSFLRCESHFQRVAEAGESVAALVVKEKLRRMVGRGCDIDASAEDPPAWLEEAVGEAPDIYSGDASPWVMAAAAHVLDTHDPDWLYVSTTDVVPHKHAPEEERAGEWVAAMDAGLASLHERSDDIVVTADHGMRHKSLCVDLGAILDDVGHDATVIRLIRDKHTYHHQNLGGAAYVYGHDGPESVEAAAAVLEDVDGVEQVLDRETAAERFRLPPDRIGDLMVLGTPAAVFGPLDAGTHGEVDLRSHGSHHEREVPYATTTDVEMRANVEAIRTLE